MKNIDIEKLLQKELLNVYNDFDLYSELEEEIQKISFISMYDFHCFFSDYQKKILEIIGNKLEPQDWAKLGCLTGKLSSKLEETKQIIIHQI